jgi:DNA-binding response OmpR family regulator
MRYLGRRLPAEGFSVQLDESLESLQTSNTVFRPDVVILGGDLPNGRALGLTKAIVASGGPPVFLLLANPSPAAAVEMLDAGATDCMPKPFLIGELAARLRKLVRQDLARRGLAAGVHADGLDIDFIRWRVQVNDMEIVLTQKEQVVLRLLVQEAGKVVSTRSIFENIWGYDLPPDKKKLNPVVAGLRRKLGLRPGAGVQLVAEVPLGYRLVLPVSPTPFYSPSPFYSVVRS